MPAEHTRALRQLLARRRTAARIAICGIIHRKPRKPPIKKLFRPGDSKWLLAQHDSDTE